VPRNAADAVDLLGSPELAARHIFTDFATENVLDYGYRDEAAMPSFSLSLLTTIDRLCGQFAAALHNAEWHVYATLTLLIVLSALLFRKSDP
jgi:hypothetical protein